MRFSNPERVLISSFVLSSIASIVLYSVGATLYDDRFLGFLVWNLFLAWLPVILAWLLVKHLSSQPWVSPLGLIYSFLWLGFLPNSFYIASDFIHVRYASANETLYYVATILLFTLTGFLLGFSSLLMVHRQLIKRFGRLQSHFSVGAVLLLCSFAIYLGRVLRWNTWDVLVNPAGIIFDVSDRLINPAAYGQTFQVTMFFFILLGSLYGVVWKATESLHISKK